MGITNVYMAVNNTLKTAFPVSIPYEATVPSFGGPWGFTLNTKGLDPLKLTAEVVVQRRTQLVLAFFPTEGNHDAPAAGPVGDEGGRHLWTQQTMGVSAGIAGHNSHLPIHPTHPQTLLLGAGFRTVREPRYHSHAGRQWSIF